MPGAASLYSTTRCSLEGTRGITFLLDVYVHSLQQRTNQTLVQFLFGKTTHKYHIVFWTLFGALKEKETTKSVKHLWRIIIIHRVIKHQENLILIPQKMKEQGCEHPEDSGRGSTKQKDLR